MGAPGAFRIKDCALIALSTGRRAFSLRELHDGLQAVDAESIYHHFWGTRLHPRFDDPEFQNDFASWARHSLHDGPMAERLGVIDPTVFATLDELRARLLEALEERQEENPELQWRRAEFPFNFVTAQVVVFDTRREVAEPRDLPRAVGEMSPGSVFYHAIDARRRSPAGIDDLRGWLLGYGERWRAAVDALANIDPFFMTLTELRRTIAARLQVALEGETS